MHVLTRVLLLLGSYPSHRAKIASTLAEQQRRQEEFSRLQQAFLNAQSLFEGEKVKLVEELDEVPSSCPLPLVSASRLVLFHQRATRLAAKEEELQAMDHEAHTEREANRQVGSNLSVVDAGRRMCSFIR